MLEKLIAFDKELLLFLNGYHHPFLDFIFWYATNAWTWLPVYFILIFLSIKLYRRQAIFIVLFAAICIACTDLASVNFFKEVFQRYRPTHNLEIREQVHILHDYRGGLYGFVSSHAANFFGLATFLSVVFYRKVRHFIPLIFLWVGIIAYSRIYLGVHYPADIFFGALLGIIIGLLIGFAFRLVSEKLLKRTAFFRLKN
ncbi:MAG: phosphatase PAP2 family protein [Bacteroidales bacterium]|jgi:undecaprenyl-diphosphatase|nr:phosphatase PAP2 family protein [Bacteroidales bacterium]MDD4215602.1 phosphatase PAP2 family protein [Bacteroidales bacterium]